MLHPIHPVRPSSPLFLAAASAARSVGQRAHPAVVQCRQRKLIRPDEVRFHQKLFTACLPDITGSRFSSARSRYNHRHSVGREWEGRWWHGEGTEARAARGRGRCSRAVASPTARGGGGGERRKKRRGTRTPLKMRSTKVPM